MDIKIGMFARFTPFGEKKASIGKVIQVEENLCIIDTHLRPIQKHLIKTADNLEDLLIVGDIVHYEISGIKDMRIIRDLITLESIQRAVKFLDAKITHIELAENRVKQEVESEKDE